MPYNPDTSYSIYTTARPIRTAFLIDPNTTTDELLDAIYDFNLDQWGGRYNPIIPVLDGKIPDPYFHLMRFCDPDVIYTYTTLSENTVSKIDSNIGPSRFIKHWEPPSSSDRWKYRVSEHYGLRPDIKYCISRLHNPLDAVLYPQPSILVCREKSKCSDYRLVQRNFGIYDDTPLVRKLPPGVSPLLIEESTGLVTALLARSISPAIIYPIKFAALDSGPNEIEDAYRYSDFWIVFGEDVWSWLWIWNRIFYLPAWERTQLSQICLPVSFLQKTDGIANLRDFISRFVYRTENNPPDLVFESYDLTESQLSEYAKMLTDKVDAIPSVRALKRGEIPSFKYESHQSIFRGEGKHYRFHSKRAFVALDIPQIHPGGIAQFSWMMDTRVEYRPERFSYMNTTYWWILPQKRRLANLFARYRLARITNLGLLSIEVSDKEQQVEIVIPDDMSVFQSIYVGEERPYLTKDLRVPSTRPYGVVGFSDKGRYARGYLQLFPSLYHASQLWENKFWREVFEWLCRRDPVEVTRVEERLRNTIRKRLDYLKSQLYLNPDDASSSLVQLIANEARNVALITPEARFDQLLDRLNRERKAFKESDPQHADFDVTEETNKKDLQEALSALTEGSIFLQGIKPKCPSCGSLAWYSTEEIAHVMKCRGCKAEIPLPVESCWVYRLNELFVKAIAFHGVLPVVWTLGELLHQSRESFLFIPSVKLYDKWEDKEAVSEVDITCILDGKVLVGEVKTSAEEFHQDDLQRLELICRKILPDIVVLSAFTGDRARLSTLVNAMKTRLSDLQIEIRPLMPLSHLFEPVYHI